MTEEEKAVEEVVAEVVVSEAAPEALTPEQVKDAVVQGLCSLLKAHPLAGLCQPVGEVVVDEAWKQLVEVKEFIEAKLKEIL